MSTPDPAQGMAKAYDPRAVEARWYAHWEDAGYFAPVREPGTSTVYRHHAAAERHR